jgi:hypothetical protein
MDARIFVKKITDTEWTDFPRSTPLTNRSMHHGYVVKVPANSVDTFLKRYSPQVQQSEHV